MVQNAGGMVLSLPSSVAVGASPLQAWGYNAFGELGSGDTTGSNVCFPECVASNVLAAAGGGLHSLFIKRRQMIDGSTISWT
jgi:hypothetical protein